MPNKFNEGDWVFEKGSSKPRCLDAKYIEAIELHGSWDDFTEWKPKDGDWVIPDSGITNDTFIVYRYEEKGFLIPNRCEPFIGQLPRSIQNKIN